MVVMLGLSFIGEFYRLNIKILINFDIKVQMLQKKK